MNPTLSARLGQGRDGPGAYAIRVSGVGGNVLLKNELLGAAGAPGPELSYCAGACWVAAGGDARWSQEFVGTVTKWKTPTASGFSWSLARLRRSGGGKLSRAAG